MVEDFNGQSLADLVGDKDCSWIKPMPDSAPGGEQGKLYCLLQPCQLGRNDPKRDDYKPCNCRSHEMCTVYWLRQIERTGIPRDKPVDQDYNI